MEHVESVPIFEVVDPPPTFVERLIAVGMVVDAPVPTLNCAAWEVPVMFVLPG
jgi:hypothetical protein